MITYLYVKTHNVTGFKYLGQTTRDPYKYPGSGTHWVRHLKAHGYDYTTEILRECTSKEEVRELGLYYSVLWNVVESREWANLRPESGNGGFNLSQEVIAKRAATLRSKHTTQGLTAAEAKSYKVKIQTRLDRISTVGFTKKEEEQHSKYGYLVQVTLPSDEICVYGSCGKASKALGIDVQYGLKVCSTKPSFKNHIIIKLRDPQVDCR